MHSRRLFRLLQQIVDALFDQPASDLSTHHSLLHKLHKPRSIAHLLKSSLQYRLHRGGYALISRVHHGECDELREAQLGE